MVYVLVVFTIWIAIPAFTTLTAYFSTDIIDGVCVPLGVYSSVAEEKALAFSLFFVTYLLPLMLMIFCYSRIVYTLHTKVTKCHCYSEFWYEVHETELET